MPIEQTNETPEKVLIVKPSSLGDIFHAFPAVSLLAAAWPNCEFHWLVAPQFASVIEYSPSVSKTIIFPRQELGSISGFLPSFLKLRRELRQENYSKVIDFQGLFRSAFFARIAPATEHIGFAAPRESLAKLFYSRTITIPDSSIHAVDRNLFMAEQICGLAKPFDELQPLPSINNFAANSAKLLSDAGCSATDIIIGVALGARWASKRWPDNFFIDLIGQLTAKVPNCKIVLLGADDSLSCAANIIKSLKHQSIVSLVGKTTLTELIEIIHRCKLLICNDSGPMHIAAAADTPAFAFFGPTIPAKTGPYGSKHHIFQRNLDCIGCLKRYCSKESILCHELNIDEITTAICTAISDTTKQQS